MLVRRPFHTPRRAGPPARAGATLVEVLVAAVILAVVALATAACLYHARAQARLQGDRRLALEMANSRLEELRGAAYATLCPLARNYTPCYVDRMTGAWRVSAADPGETVTLAGQSQPITTTVQYQDACGGGTTYDCLRIKVKVQYRAGANNVVNLETMRSP